MIAGHFACAIAAGTGEGAAATEKSSFPASERFLPAPQVEMTENNRVK